MDRIGGIRKPVFSFSETIGIIDRDGKWKSEGVRRYETGKENNLGQTSSTNFVMFAN